MKLACKSATGFIDFCNFKTNTIFNLILGLISQARIKCYRLIGFINVSCLKVIALVFTKLGCVTCHFFNFSFISFIFYKSSLLFIPEKDILSLKKNYVYDDNGELIFEFFNNKIDNIYFNELPIHTIQAFIAKEDSNFFKHRGISLSAIIRSLIINIKSRKFLQGGSTITQQMIKLKRGNLKKTFGRKIIEQFLALAIESKFTKEV